MHPLWIVCAYSLPPQAFGIYQLGQVNSLTCPSNTIEYPKRHASEDSTIGPKKTPPDFPRPCRLGRSTVQAPMPLPLHHGHYLQHLLPDNMRPGQACGQRIGMTTRGTSLGR